VAREGDVTRFATGAHRIVCIEAACAAHTEIGLPAERCPDDSDCCSRGAGVHWTYDGLEVLPATGDASAEPAAGFWRILGGVSGHTPDYGIRDTAERNRHGLRVGLSRPAGLLAGLSSVPLLPRYSLAVLAIFVHLACQARWNLKPPDLRIRGPQRVIQRDGFRWGGYCRYQPCCLWRAFYEINYWVWPVRHAIGTFGSLQKWPTPEKRTPRRGISPGL